MTDTQTNMTGSGQRWLKTLNGTVYGPADSFTLCLWAADARITPGCFISDNGADWRQAESVPELRMQWLVDLPEGAPYGPLNLLALWELVREESVRAGTRIVNPATGKTATLDESVLPLLFEEWRALLTGAGRSARESVEGLLKNLRAGEAGTSALSSTVEALERKLQATEKDLAVSLKLVSETQRFLATRDETVRALDAKLRDAEDRARRWESESQRLAGGARDAGSDRRLAEADAKILSLERALAEADKATASRVAQALAAQHEAESKAVAASVRAADAERKAADMAQSLQARVAEATSLQRDAEERAAAAERRVDAMAMEVRRASEQREEAVRAAMLSAQRLEEAGSELRRAREDLRVAVEQAEQAARRANEEGAAARAECDAMREALESERALREQREKELSEEQGRLSSEAERLQGILEEATDALKRAEEERERKDGENAVLRDEIDQARRRADGDAAALKHQIDEAVKRAGEAEAQAGKMRSEMESAHASAVETEKRLREELASVRRELNAMMMLRTAILRVNEDMKPGSELGHIDWLGSGPASPAEAKSGFDGLPIAAQVAALQDEIKASVAARTRLKKENEALQRESSERQAAFAAREDTLKSRIQRLQEEKASSEAMIRKAMEEVEMREGLLRGMRRKAEEREQELLGRIAQLEQAPRAEVVDGEGEWEHPGVAGEPVKDRTAGAPKGGHDILAHVEAQLREELRKWDSHNSGSGPGREKDRKWFWRK